MRWPVIVRERFTGLFLKMCGNVDIVLAKDDRAEIVRRLKALPWAPLEVTHRFQDGLYTRAGKVSAGNLIVGFKHRLPNIFHLSKGSVIVWDKFHGTRRLDAPYSEVTFPGTQRLGFALTDIEGCNLVATVQTSVAEVEEEMFYPFDFHNSLQELGDTNFVRQIEN